jgi:heptaprenylglyceryl phosphate synthase
MNNVAARVEAAGESGRHKPAEMIREMVEAANLFYGPQIARTTRAALSVLHDGRDRYNKRV